MKSPHVESCVSCTVTALQVEHAARGLAAVLAEQNSFLAQAAHLSEMVTDAKAKVSAAEADLSAASEQVWCLLFHSVCAWTRDTNKPGITKTMQTLTELVEN